ncbi:MAG: N-acetyltransferase [Sporocytophaga sp.]|jgi:predicted GNAT family acetyltransferase|nr:N-acetyltransferase [Sporocytophaga sp.]
MELFHDNIQHKFVLTHDGKEFSTSYRMLGHKFWDFYYTTIPNEVIDESGKEILLNYVLDFVKANHIKIRATCLSVQEFLVNHKNLKEVLYHPYSLKLV